MRQLKAFYSFYVRMAFEGSFSPILKKDSARILIHLLHVSTVSLGLAMAISITFLAHFRRQRFFNHSVLADQYIYAGQSIRAQKNGTNFGLGLIAISDGQHEQSRAELGLQRG